MSAYRLDPSSGALVRMPEEPAPTVPAPVCRADYCGETPAEGSTLCPEHLDAEAHRLASAWARVFDVTPDEARAMLDGSGMLP